MIISPIEILWEIGGLVIFIFGIKTWLAYKKNAENKLVNYFGKFNIFTGLGFAIAAPLGPVITSSFFLAAGTISSLFILFVAAAYLTRISFTFLFPNLEKKVFWLIIFLDILLLTVLIKNFSYYTFIQDPRTRVSFVNYPAVAEVLMIIICAIALFVPGLIFIFKGLKSSDKKITTRAVLLGLGMIFFGIGGATNSLVSAISSLASVSAISLTLGFLFALIGMFYTIEKTTHQSNF